MKSVLLAVLSITSTFSEQACSPKQFECSYDDNLGYSSISTCKKDGSILRMSFEGNNGCINYAEIITNLIAIQPSSPCCLIETDEDLDDHQHGLIVGGTVATALDYPFIVDFRMEYSNGNVYVCGGSLLRLEYPAIILTAAHCIAPQYEKDHLGHYILDHNGNKIIEATFNKDGAESYVALDADKRHAADSNDDNVHRGYKFHISDHAYHHPYDPIKKDFDVAVLVLDEDLTKYSHLSHLRTVNINKLLSSITEYSNGLDLTVIGYGNDIDGAATKTLEHIDIDYMSRTQCQQKYFTHLTSNMICGYRSGVDSCQGDSGGPLIKKGTFEQIGIVSFGKGCGSDPGVYTNIGLPAIYNWIEEEKKYWIDLYAHNA